MKFFLRIILIGVLTYFLSLIVPWWIIVVIGFLGGLLLPSNSLTAFVSGFLGVGIVWMSYAWKLDSANESRFSALIGEILMIDDPMLVIVLVGVVGGLCGGFSTMSGSLLRQPTSKEKPSEYYQ